MRDYSDDDNQESITKVRPTEEEWEEPDFDEEDGMQEMNDYPEHASSPSESGSVEEQPSEEPDKLLRIKVLKDVEDPILMADGTEVVLAG